LQTLLPSHVPPGDLDGWPGPAQVAGPGSGRDLPFLSETRKR
jgi:hypothetical protein